MTDENNFWKSRSLKEQDGLWWNSVFKKFCNPKKSNPLETWEELKELFPGLKRQTRRHTMIIASSALKKRLFFKADDTVKKRKKSI